MDDLCFAVIRRASKEADDQILKDDHLFFIDVRNCFFFFYFF